MAARSMISSAWAVFQMLNKLKSSIVEMIFARYFPSGVTFMSIGKWQPQQDLGFIL
jgi:hypothetical protein